MAINKELWQEPTLAKEFLCPHCEYGTLRIKKNKDGKTLLEQEQTPASKREEDALWEEINYSIDVTEYVFTAILECRVCGELVVTGGDSSVNENFDPYDHEGEEITMDYYNICTPEYFHPAVPIFKIPKACPDSVKAVIKEAFKLFLVDENACGNKIRIALEKLMNELKIRKTYTSKKGKRIHYTLDARIKLFKDKYPQISQYLMAVKWIVNQGSHANNLNREDILLGFELLDYALEELYNPRSKQMLQISKQINKNKGIKVRQ